MVDFSKLLSKSADDITKPKPVPVGTYSGVIKKYEYLESKNENKTAYVRFAVRLQAPHDDVDPSDLEGVDLTKKSLRKDFYLTEDAQYRVKEFAESCGVATSGRSLAEIIPDIVNAQVLVGNTQQSSPDGSEIYNNVNTIVGA